MKFFRCKFFYEDDPGHLMNFAVAAENKNAAELFIKDRVLEGTSIELKTGSLKECSEDEYKIILFAKEVSGDQA